MKGGIRKWLFVGTENDADAADVISLDVGLNVDCDALDDAAVLDALVSGCNDCI